ncbi:hypothetical protein ACSMX9_23995 [Streptomyces sp. LE64]|uniref:hypothetical protein n=1 Tax=Streptomyces sp. LE64 TaxID=3448653 RepID=UPI004042363E
MTGVLTLATGLPVGYWHAPLTADGPPAAPAPAAERTAPGARAALPDREEDAAVPARSAAVRRVAEAGERVRSLVDEGTPGGVSAAGTGASGSRVRV